MIIENELTKEEIAMFNSENTPLWRLCCAMATNIEMNMRKIKELETKLKLENEVTIHQLEEIDSKIETHESTVGLHSQTI